MSQEVQYTLARHQNRRPAGHIRSRWMMLISLAFLLYIPAVILSINALISEDHSWGLGVAQTSSQPPTWQITWVDSGGLAKQLQSPAWQHRGQSRQSDTKQRG